MMTTETTTPRAWVGCLACYNAGSLIGAWVEGVEAGDMTTAALHAAMFAPGTGPRPGEHEELWVMDHEGYGPALSGECSPAEAQSIAELLDSVPEHQRDALAAYIDHVGDLHEAVDAFEVAYRGEWDSEREYAEELADDLYGIASRGQGDDIAARYFDYDAFARDLFMGDYVSMPAPGMGVYVFDLNA